MNEELRQAFEKKHPPPYGVAWSDEHNDFVLSAVIEGVKSHHAQVLFFMGRWEGYLSGRAEGMEQAAGICEGLVNPIGHYGSFSQACDDCATAIREAARQQEPT